MNQEYIDKVKHLLDDIGDEVGFVFLARRESSVMLGDNYNPVLVVGQLEAAKLKVLQDMQAKGGVVEQPHHPDPAPILDLSRC